MKEHGEEKVAASVSTNVDGPSWPQDRPDLTDPEIVRLDRSCVRKLDFTVLPVCAMFYFLSFLDRSNIGNAKVAGLQYDLYLTSTQYLTAVTCTYVLYIAFELPSNLLLKRIGPHLLLPAMVTSWGIVCTLTCLVRSYAGLIIVRLVLGGLEGGLFPGLVLYLSMFYRRRELQLRISLFFSAASLSGAFSGLLAAALEKIHSEKPPGYYSQGWRFIFAIEGIFTVVFGVFSFFVFPARPSTALFLKPAEREHVERRLLLDVPEGAGEEQNDHFRWIECWRSLKSPHVLMLAVCLFGNGCTLFSYAYFTPSIVAIFKYSTTKTQLLTVPPYACAFVVTMFNAYFSDRYGRRGACVIAMSILAITGLAVFYTHTGRSARYGSLFLAIIGVYGTAPALTTWMPNNSAPHYRKATSVAIAFIMTNSGGIMSTWLFPTKEAPNYKRATRVNLAMATLTAVFAALNLVYLRHENKKKDAIMASGKIDPVESATRWYVEGDRHPSFRYGY